jgi:O-antigen/teichoic acid export membrane protein
MRDRIVSGSLTLLAGSAMVGVTNLIYNLAVARLLGPADFGHATVVYTLLMLMSAVTLSFQIVCTKLVANHEPFAEKAAVYVGLHRRAWITGVACACLMAAFRSPIRLYLNLPNSSLVLLLALGTAFYIPLGVRRGWIQGVLAFNHLVLNLVLEGVVRLGAALVLIELGFGVTGAVWACVAAIVLSYLAAAPGPQLEVVPAVPVPVSFREGLQATVFFAGQVVINNFDIVLVKHFFPPAEAGLYAAVALVGRLVNMCSWSVVNSMFPLSAGTPGDEEEEGRPVLVTSLFLVFVIVTLLVLVLWLVPGVLWKMLFGMGFELAGSHTIASLLVLYAVTSGIYSLSSVIITYEMSRKIANTGWVQLAFSGAIVLGLCLFHSTLQQVIVVQLGLMLMLLLIVLLPFVYTSAADLLPRAADVEYRQLRTRRLLTQEEVVSEFLKSEFDHPRFNDYRARFEQVVNHPNLDDAAENSLRRALLFVRRGAMWRELPDDTKWFELDLERGDLARIRFFPRAQWRRMAQGRFYLTDLIENIRAGVGAQTQDEFFRKLQRLRELIRQQGVHDTVLLIGRDENSPLTILDGNHRIAAVMLEGPSPVLKRFRFICGFSPNMTQCCWYKTNMTTLWRYAKNLVKYLPYDPESEIEQFLLEAPE